VLSTPVRRLVRLLFVFYYLEAGAFLLLSPWSRFWSERVAGRAPRSLEAPLSSPYVRGFVAGLGLLHIAFALSELEMVRRELSGRGAGTTGRSGPSGA